LEPPRFPGRFRKLVGQKAPLKLKEIWAIRVRLQLEHRARELALFNLGIDSKLRGCDLVRLRVQDICHGNRVGYGPAAGQLQPFARDGFGVGQRCRNSAASQ